MSTELLEHGLRERGVEQTEDGTYQLDIHGVPIEMRTVNGFQCVIEEHRFFDKYVSTVATADVVADVGANRGIYALAAATMADRVHAFELDPENIERITVNAALNEWGDVEVVGKAVSDTTENLSAALGEDGFSHLGGNEVVPATTLDAYFEGKETPDVIKLDVEGAEGRVLDGAEAVLEERPTLFIELHPDSMLDRYDDSPDAVLERLEEFGSTVTDIEERRSRMVIADTRSHGPILCPACGTALRAYPNGDYHCLDCNTWRG